MTRRSVINAPRIESAFVLDQTVWTPAADSGIENKGNRLTELEKAQEKKLREMEQAECRRTQQAEQAEAARRSEHQAQIKHLERIARGLAAAEEKLNRQQEELPEQVVRLALTIAARLTARDLDENSHEIAAAGLSEILGELPASDINRVRLNPADLDLITSDEHSDITGADLHAVADPSVKPGNCIAEAKFGTVDATVDARWARMVELLTQSRQNNSPEGETEKDRTSGTEATHGTQDQLQTRTPEPAEAEPGEQSESGDNMTRAEDTADDGTEDESSETFATSVVTETEQTDDDTADGTGETEPTTEASLGS